jgi:hypothetical protein
MKILLQTADDFIFLAGDGRLGERVFPKADGFELAGELERQIVRKVRGGHARALNRGNIRHRAFFRTRRLFPSEQEAEDYAANAERSFPRTGTLYFVTGGGTRKLLQARVNPPATTVQGCEARLQYQVEGGQFTPLEPELVIDGLEGIKQRFVSDEAGEWFECGFDSPEILSGNAADGWTDEFGHWRLRLERSIDLVNWDYQWEDAPGSPVLASGVYTYWGRSKVPRLWKYVTVDETLTSDRANKSITMLNLFGANITAGMSYPYAMPSQAATLQAHLIAAGYTGTVVSNVAKSMSVVVTNWTNGGADDFPVTLSGSNVTMVKNASGANISLPGYPYAMPAQITNLQAALIAAGFPYASARVFGDEWTIFIPNRNAILNQRQFIATISPADPYTYQGPTGTGTDAGSTLTGTVSNIRATTGLAPLSEAPNQFARLGASRGPNHLY